MNRYKWIIYTLYTVAFVIAGSTSLFIVRNMFASDIENQQPSVEKILQSVETQSQNHRTDQRSWRDYYQGIVQAKIGPESKETKKQPRQCPVKKYVKNIVQVHGNQGIQIESIGKSGRSSYLLKGESIQLGNPKINRNQQNNNVWVNLQYLGTERKQAKFAIHLHRNNNNNNTTSCQGTLPLPKEEDDNDTN